MSARGRALPSRTVPWRRWSRGVTPVALVFALVASLASGAVVAFAGSSSPSAPASLESPAPLSLAATAPSGLGCASVNAAGITLTLLTSSSGIPGSSAQLTLAGFDFSSPVEVYFAASNGTELSSTLVDVYPGGSTTVNAYVPGDWLYGHDYAPGSYNFWAEDVNSNCAYSTTFTLTAVPPPSLYCSFGQFNTAVLSVSPDSGPAGTTVTLTSSGFAPYGSTSIYWSTATGSPSQFVESVTAPSATSSGAFVPSSGLSPGTYAFWGVDSYNDCAGATFQVTPPPVTPSISANSLVMAQDGTLTITGTGFTPAPGTAILYWNGAFLAPTGGSDCAFNGWVIEQDASGNFVCTFTPPPGVLAGANQIYVEDTFSSVDSNTISVQVLELSFSNGVAAGPAGTALTASAQGWTPGDWVEVGVGPSENQYADVAVNCTGTPNGVAIVGLGGTFACSFAFPSVPATPYASSFGPGNYSVYATDLNQTPIPPLVVNSSNTFELWAGVSPIGPNIFVGPANLPIGATFTVNGWGFTPDNLAQPALYNPELVIQPTGGSSCPVLGGLILTNASGDFDCTFVLPADPGACGSTICFAVEDTATQAYGEATISVSSIDHSPPEAPAGTPESVSPEGLATWSYVTLTALLGNPPFAYGTFEQFALVTPGPDSQVAARLAVPTELVGPGGYATSFSIVLPSVAAGDYYLYGADPVTGNFANSSELQLTAPSFSVDTAGVPELGVGNTYAVSASGLVPDEAYLIELDPIQGQYGAGSQFLDYLPTDSSGSFSSELTVMDLTAGPTLYYIDLYYENLLDYTGVWYTLTASSAQPSVAQATIDLGLTITSPSVPFGPPGTIVTVSGAGGTPGDGGALEFLFLPPPTSVGPINTIPVTCLNSVTIDGAGDFSCEFVIPSYERIDLSYEVVATDESTGATGSTLSPFLLGTSPAFSIDPASGPAGTQISFSDPDGGLAPDGVTYAVYLDPTAGSIGGGSALVGTFDSTDAGTIPLEPLAIPQGVVNDTSYSVDIFQTASGTNSYVGSASDSFEPTQASIYEVSPATGAPGPVAISGSGFASGTSYDVYLDGTSGVYTSSPVGDPSPIGSCATPAESNVLTCAANLPAGLMPGTYFVDLFEAPVAYDSGGQTLTTAPSYVLTAYSFTIQTGIGVSIGQGPVGAYYSVVGAGFADSGPVKVLFDHAGQTSVGCSQGTFSGTTITADSSGGFQCGFLVPKRAAGVYEVVAEPTGTTDATFPVPFTITTPRISVSPGRGPVEAPVTLTGTGFSPDQPLSDVTFGGGTVLTCLPPFDIVANQTGAFECPFFVPADSGVTPVTVTDAGGAVAATHFDVTTPRVHLSAARGPVGATVALSGTGLPVNEEFSVVFDGVTNPTCLVGLYSTGPTGAFSCSLLVPAGTSGTSVVVIYLPATSVSATFQVTPVEIVLHPASGPVGATLRVTGTGFSVRATVDLLFGGTPITVCSGGGLTTSASGGFSCSFAVPSAPLGPLVVEVIDPGGQIALADFTVTLAH